MAHGPRRPQVAAEGTIEIFFDDMTKPVMTAKDKTFASGQIGIGTFDDTSDWDDVQVDGVAASSAK